MILRHATNYDTKIAKKIYMQSFPFIERKPWHLIKKWAKAGRIDLLVGRDETGITGLIIAVPYKDLVLFDYLAVNSELRNKGNGSKILSLAEKHYEGMRLALVAEIEDENANNNEQRIKRMRFYDRNGWKRTSNVCVATSGEMEILTKGDINTEEFLAINKYGMGAFLFKMSKMHTVPLNELLESKKK